MDLYQCTFGIRFQLMGDNLGTSWNSFHSWVGRELQEGWKYSALCRKESDKQPGKGFFSWGGRWQQNLSPASVLPWQVTSKAERQFHPSEYSVFLLRLPTNRCFLFQETVIRWNNTSSLFGLRNWCLSEVQVNAQIFLSLFHFFPHCFPFSFAVWSCLPRQFSTENWGLSCCRIEQARFEAALQERKGTRLNLNLVFILLKHLDRLNDNFFKKNLCSYISLCL